MHFFSSIKTDYSVLKLEKHIYMYVQRVKKAFFFLPLLNRSLQAFDRHDFRVDSVLPGWPSVGFCVVKDVTVLFYLQKSLGPERCGFIPSNIAVFYESMYLILSTKQQRALRSLLIRKEMFCICYLFCILQHLTFTNRNQ